MKEAKRGIGHEWVLWGIALLLFCGFILLLIFSAAIYQKTVETQSESDGQREILAYLSARAESMDAEGCASSEAGPEGTALILRDGPEADDAETRIYLYHGQLLEEYTTQDAEFQPDEAQTIGQTETFAVTKLDDTTLHIQTDTGAIVLHFRCGGEFYE